MKYLVEPPSKIGQQLRSMIAKAVQWAKASNKHRVSPVHGEEEIYLILSETFQAKEVEQEEMTREGNVEVQVGYSNILMSKNCQLGLCQHGRKQLRPQKF